MFKGRGRLAAGGLGLLMLTSCGARTSLYLDQTGASAAGSGSAPSGASGSTQGGAGPTAGSAPTAGSSTCLDDDDQSCPSGFVCANGLCVTRCDSDTECRGGYLCSGHVCAVRALAIVAGESHACVEVYDGSIHCWGDGSSGQLGNGTPLASQVPVSVVGFPRPGGVRVRELSAGGAFTCAFLTDSSVSCWGSGAVGELGNGGLAGSAVPGAASVVPRAVVHSGSGFGHSCAQVAGGKIGCWGANYYGQLGDGTFAVRADFSNVVGLPEGADPVLSVGGTHSCALAGDLTVRCWGDNRFAQLGRLRPESSARPLLVDGLTDSGLGVSSLAAGGSHTCALLSDRSVRCWGDNQWYQLGTTQVARSTTPVRVPNIPNGNVEAAQLCSGSRHSCVLMVDGSVRCWGIGGALGNGSATASAIPVVVQGLIDDPSRSVKKIACGGTTSCALIDDGTVRCWSDRVGRSLSF